MEILGEPSGVHKAVELIAGQLRKFLVDRSVLPLFEMPVSGRMIPFILFMLSSISSVCFFAATDARLT